MDTVFKQIYFSILPELMDRMEEKEDAEELENALLIVLTMNQKHCF